MATRVVTFARKSGGVQRRYELGNLSASAACTEASQVLSNPNEKAEFAKVSEQGKDNFLDDLSQVKPGTILLFWTAADLRSEETKRAPPAPNKSPRSSDGKLPKAQATMAKIPGRQGKPLCHNARWNAHRGLPPFVRHCIDYLKKYGLQTEGIFRVPGTDAGMNEVKKIFDEHPADVELNANDVKDVSVPNVAGALKKYFRNLSEPVVPFDSYATFLAVDDFKQDVTPRKCQALRLAISRLPRINQSALREICDLCRAIADQCEINLMTSSNCAIVFAPSLLDYPHATGSLSSVEFSNKMQQEIARIARVIQLMIDGYSQIFERLVQVETNSLKSIKKVNFVFNRRVVQKGENESSLPKALCEGLTEESLPAVFGCLVPKLGDFLVQSAPPKLRTFDELRKQTQATTSTEIEEMKMIAEAGERVKMHNLRVEVNDVSVIAHLIETSGFTRALPELDEMIEHAGKALGMLGAWIVHEGQDIFRRWFFSAEWMASKHNTTKEALDQLKRLIEENVRPLKSDGYRRVLLEHITRGLLGQYCIVFAAKANSFRLLRVDETKLKLRLKEDEELIIDMFCDVLRLAQSSVYLNQEVMSVTGALLALFSVDVKDITPSVKVIVKYTGNLGTTEVREALTDLLFLRSGKYTESILPPKNDKVNKKNNGSNINANSNNEKSRWVLDIQIHSIALLESPDRKRCDVTLNFRSGAAVVETTTLRDVWTHQKQCASVQKHFDSVAFEVKLGNFLSAKIIGTARIDTDTIRQELILASNLALAESAETAAIWEDKGVAEVVSHEGVANVMAKFKEGNRNSVAVDTLLAQGFFAVTLDICQDNQVTGVLSLALRYTRDPWMDMSRALISIDTEDHDTLWELNGDPRAEDLKDCMFQLQDIPDRWHLGVEQYLNKDHKDQQIANGFMAMLAALKDLYYMPDPRWHRIRDRIEVGLIKATRNCGNTSVSMGLAQAYLSKEMLKPNGRRSVAFLNCGTGGVKMQLYACKGGPVFAMMEAKPRKCSISVIQIGGYFPAKDLLSDQGEEAPIPAEIFISMLDKELTKAPWNRAELQAPMRKFLNNQTNQMPEVFAFVTGSIRGYWENKDLPSTEKSQLEAVVAQIFGNRAKPASSILHPESVNYFIQQEDEGAMELLALQSMYKAIGSLLPQFHGVEVLASLGIGLGSSQWAEQKDTVAISHGMISPHLLSNLGRTIVKNYQDPVKFDAFLTSLENAARPVLALKSGCLLQVYDKIVGAGLRNRLCYGDPIPEEEQESRSLARVCAEAGAALKANEHFLQARIENGRVLFLSPYAGDQSFQEFATDGKVEEWQENPLKAK